MRWKIQMDMIWIKYCGERARIQKYGWKEEQITHVLLLLCLWSVTFSVLVIDIQAILCWTDFLVVSQLYLLLFIHFHSYLFISVTW